MTYGLVNQRQERAETLLAELTERTKLAMQASTGNKPARFVSPHISTPSVITLNRPGFAGGFLV
jgi:hypothetical protein